MVLVDSLLGGAVNVFWVLVDPFGFCEWFFGFCVFFFLSFCGLFWGVCHVFFWVSILGFGRPFRGTWSLSVLLRSKEKCDIYSLGVSEEACSFLAFFAGFTLRRFP